MAGSLVVDTLNGVNIAVSPPATQAWATSQDFGIGQTRQDVTTSRSLGTSFTYSGTKPMFIHVILNVSASTTVSLIINGITYISHTVATAGMSGYVFSTPILPGEIYSVTSSATTLLKWYETR